MLGRYLGVLSLFLLATMLGCDSNDDSHLVQPGFFKLANSYELGDLKNTTPFVFNFLNGGDTDVVNITLTSSNPAFIVDPQFISVLEPLSDQTLNQSLRIIAIHGTGENGIGGAEAMPPGKNQTVLRIAGKTTNAKGDTLIASQQAAVRVNALLVQVEVNDISGPIALDSISAGTIVSGGVAPYPLRTFRTADGPIRVSNTGNVDLSIRIYRRLPVNAAVYEEEDVRLLAREEIDIERESQTTILRIDGNDTISSQLLPIEDDGMIYLGFR